MRRNILKTPEQRLTGQELTASGAPARRTDRGKLFLILLLYLPCLFVHTELDNDIWFLLSNGRYILQNGIPFIEPLTLHQNLSYVSQQWLSTVIFWFVYSKLGALGLFALVAVVFAGVITLIYRLNNLLSDGNLAVSFVVTMFFSVLLSTYTVTRPTMFTLLILAAELYLLERYTASNRPSHLIPLPLLSALLVNLHASMWPIQFVILLPYVIDSFRFRVSILEGQGFDKKFFYPAILLMFAAGFLNPYGFDAMSYLARSYGHPEISFVSEMRVPNINEVFGKVIFGTFVIVGAAYLLYRAGKTRLRYVLLTGGTAVLALSNVRSFSFFILCGIFPLAYYLKDVQPPKSKQTVTKKTLVLRGVLIALIAAMLGYGVFYQYAVNAATKAVPESAPALSYLLTNAEQDDMVLYAGYNDGGYAEYLGFKPYLDPRAEVFVKKNNKKDDIMLEYFLLQTGGLYYQDVLDKYGFTHLLVAKTDILYTYLPHDDSYQMVFEDKLYAVFVHAGAAP